MSIVAVDRVIGVSTSTIFRYGFPHDLQPLKFDCSCAHDSQCGKLMRVPKMSRQPHTPTTGDRKIAESACFTQSTRVSGPDNLTSYSRPLIAYIYITVEIDKTYFSNLF
ncbi:hypothetical protein CLIB1423_36S00540 [[Candida] railenensis]|uniref:Uncharacterized protein n=1 Tax=[Candida] railenensis TaxID=45579 RepID=A0A9P0QWK4_9ASCO|nr:hypothetical protein CLIB1423_36S00540 [[Candida] railenensis]